jgi:hypothetical protein
MGKPSAAITFIVSGLIIIRISGLFSSQSIALTPISGLIFGKGDKNHDPI